METAPRTNPRISFLAFFLIWADYKGWEVPHTHVRMCNWLERFYFVHRVAVLEVFRGGAKSTVVAVFQAWILYGDCTYHLLDQAADDKTARKLSKDTRGVLRRHPLCVGMLPRGDQAVDSIEVIGNDDERNPSVSAHGVLSNVTGSRADAVVFDDVEMPKNIRSAAAREYLRERMDEATHILVPGGKKLYIGTPHTFDSIYDEQVAAGAHLLKIPLFEHNVRYEQTDKQRRYPYNFECNRSELHVFVGIGRDARLLVDGIDYKVDRKAVIFSEPTGALLDIYSGCTWPERFTREELEHRRKQCRRIGSWDSQYMLHAVPIHEVRLDPNRIKVYDVQPTIAEANGEVRMMLGTTRIISASAWWDCSLGKVKSDDSALCVIFTNERGELFWHVAKAMLGDPFEQCQQVRTVLVGLQLERITVETNGPGGFLPPILRGVLKGTGIHVQEEWSSEEKSGRILDGLEPPLMGRFLWAHTDAIDAFEHQMRAWVPRVAGQADDYLDAGASAIRQTPIRIGKRVGVRQTLPRPAWRPNAGSHEIKIGK